MFRFVETSLGVIQPLLQLDSVVLGAEKARECDSPPLSQIAAEVAAAQDCEPATSASTFCRKSWSTLRPLEPRRHSGGRVGDGARASTSIVHRVPLVTRGGKIRKSKIVPLASSSYLPRRPPREEPARSPKPSASRARRTARWRLLHELAFARPVSHGSGRFDSELPLRQEVALSGNYLDNQRFGRGKCAGRSSRREFALGRNRESRAPKVLQLANRREARCPEDFEAGNWREDRCGEDFRSAIGANIDSERAFNRQLARKSIFGLWSGRHWVQKSVFSRGATRQKALKPVSARVQVGNGPRDRFWGGVQVASETAESWRVLPMAGLAGWLERPEKVKAALAGETVEPFDWAMLEHEP